MNQVAHDTGSGRMRRLLREAILSRELAPGQKLMPTKELASRYGVAPGTAHRALGELVREGLLTRQMGRGTFVPERGELEGRGGAGVVALALPSTGHVWGELFQRLTRNLSGQGYKLQLHDLTPGAESWNEGVGRLLREPPAAVVTMEPSLADVLQSQAPELKIILVSASEHWGFRGDIVGPDNYQAGRIGVEHLLGHGHRRICLCRRGKIQPLTWECMEGDLLEKGYQAAMAEAGLEPMVAVVRDIGEADMSGLWDGFVKGPMPEALLVESDFLATLITAALRERGYFPPCDMAMVAMHNTPWAETCKLTSIDTRYPVAADYCARLLVSRELDTGCHQRVRIKPELVVRESCGCGGTSDKANKIKTGGRR